MDKAMFCGKWIVKDGKCELGGELRMGGKREKNKRLET